jgi:hypothetical protein
MTGIQTLLREGIDYAGLFPPASLDMDMALQNYVRYSTGPSAWALGRFIVPVSRLPELETGLRHLPARPIDQPWRFGALLGTEIQSDLEQLDGFKQRHSNSGLIIDTLEAKASSESSVGEIMRKIRPTFMTYLEVPIDSDPGSLIAAIARQGGRAKVRTGGVTPNAFPTTPDLVRFIRRCTEAGVPFKATAGLHHALTGEHRLTYEPGSPRAPMFGFLNLYLTVAFIRAGMSDNDAAQLLEEGSGDAFQADSQGISWRGNRLDLKALADTRNLGVISFGSCSFTEPIDDLEALGLLKVRAQRV